MTTVIRCEVCESTIFNCTCEKEDGTPVYKTCLSCEELIKPADPECPQAPGYHQDECCDEGHGSYLTCIGCGIHTEPEWHEGYPAGPGICESEEFCESCCNCSNYCSADDHDWDWNYAEEEDRDDNGRWVRFTVSCSDCNAHLHAEFDRDYGEDDICKD